MRVSVNVCYGSMDREGFPRWLAHGLYGCDGISSTTLPNRRCQSARHSESTDKSEVRQGDMNQEEKLRRS